MQTHKTPVIATAPSIDVDSVESVVPNVAFLRQPQVVGAIFPGGSTSLWRHIKAGTFPAPVKISPRISAWRRDDLIQWLERQGSTTSKAAA